MSAVCIRVEFGVCFEIGSESTHNFLPQSIPVDEGCRHISAKVTECQSCGKDYIGREGGEEKGKGERRWVERRRGGRDREEGGRERGREEERDRTEGGGMGGGKKEVKRGGRGELGKGKVAGCKGSQEGGSE